MANHYVYRDGSGNFKIRGNVSNTQFYVYTPGFYIDSNCTGTPGTVTAYASGIGNYWVCENGGSISPGSGIITWTAPADSGNCEIQYYELGISYYNPVLPENATIPYSHGDQAQVSEGSIQVISDDLSLSYINSTSVSFSGGPPCTTNSNLWIRAVNGSGAGSWSAINDTQLVSGGPNDPAQISINGNYVDLTYSTISCTTSCTNILSTSVSGYMYDYQNTIVATGTPSSTRGGPMSFLNPVASGSGLFYFKIIENFLVQDGSGTAMCINSIDTCGHQYFYLEHL